MGNIFELVEAGEQPQPKNIFESIEQQPQQPVAASPLPPAEDSYPQRRVSALRDRSIVNPTEEQSSALAAGGRSFVRSIAPTAAFLGATKVAGKTASIAGQRAGAWAGARAGAIAGALIPGAGETGIPELVLGGIGALVGYLAPGFIAQMGAAKAQETIADKIAPDSVLGSKSAAKDQEEHPWASEIGSLLAMGKPSPKSVVDAVKTLSSRDAQKALADFATKKSADEIGKWGESLSPELKKQFVNLADVAAGGAMNTTFELYNQVKSGDYSIADLGRAAAEGALFNKAWFNLHAPAPQSSIPNVIKGFRAKQVGDNPNLHIYEFGGEDRGIVEIVSGQRQQQLEQQFGGSGWNGFFIEAPKDKKGNPVEGTMPKIYISEDWIRRNGDIKGFGAIFSHESTHALKDLGFINQEQIDKVVDTFGKDLHEKTRAEYDKLSEDSGGKIAKLDDAKLKDEVFARIIEGFARNGNAPKVGFIQNSINFLRELYNNVIQPRFENFGFKKFEMGGEEHLQNILQGRLRQPARKSALRESVDNTSRQPYIDVAGQQPAFSANENERINPTEAAAESGRAGALPQAEGLVSGAGAAESPVRPDVRARIRPNAQPNQELISAADRYSKRVGLTPLTGFYTEHQPDFARKVAAEYDKLPKLDNSPETISAYTALANEVQQQWDYAVNELGIRFEPWTKDGQPYKNSREMVADVRDNKHLYFFTGGEEHPLLNKKDQHGLTMNDKLRAVHDLFGHAAEDFQFGPRGEDNAWLKHSTMFTPEAQRALTTETRGQNSWVNFGEHNFDEAGGYRNIPPAERPFAEQKVGLLPQWVSDWQSVADSVRSTHEKNQQAQFSAAATQEKRGATQGRVLGAGQEEPRNRALPSYRRKLVPGEVNGRVVLRHWSQSPRDVIDPQKQSASGVGAENARRRSYPKQYIARSYYGLKGYTKEPHLGSNLHEIEFRAERLYDNDADPLGFYDKAFEVNRKEKVGALYDDAAINTIAERLIRDAGFEGYYSRAHKIAAVFYPMPVNKPQFSAVPQTETPEFKAWFGESVSVDKNKNPIVFYHGTGADFTKFDTNKRGYTYGRGTYFTPDPRRASGYTGARERDIEDAVEMGTESRRFTELADRAGKVYPVFLKYKNPFITSSDEGVANIGYKLYKENRQEFDRLAEKVKNVMGYVSSEGMSPVEVGNEWLRENGYDSIVKEWKAGDPLEVVVFEPTQIKSAIGNSGTFDPKNPDIRFSASSIEPPTKESKESKMSRAWMSPDGKIFYTEGMPHDTWARIALNKSLEGDLTSSDGIRAFFDMGWARVVPAGRDIMFEMGDENLPTRQQVSRLKDMAIETGSNRVARDLMGRVQTVWSSPTFSAAPEKQVWRDTILDSLESWQGKGTPQQLMAHLQKTRGAVDQAEWIGLDDFLKDKSSVTKQEVADYVAANRVDLREVTLGSVEKNWAGEDFVDRSTKFEQYQTPGGENYRELLLTIKEKPLKESSTFLIKENPEESDHAGSPVFDVIDKRSGFVRYTGDSDGAQQWIRNSDRTAGTPAFHSNHFDEPNILAHIRFNERESTTAQDPTPARTMFLEEIQSDWHQKGRKRGYKKQDGLFSGFFVLNADGEIGRFEDFSKAQDFAVDYRNRTGDINVRVESSDQGAVPDAPFKQTQSWAMLAFKRALKFAVDNGFKRIAWTNGDMQNARYDLSKQLDMVVAQRYFGSDHTIITGYKNNNAVVQERVENKSLADFVGKDLAEKIEKQPDEKEVKYTGSDLQVGGKGMRKFYDEMLVSEVNKFVKKWGGKVGEAQIQSAKHNPNKLPFITELGPDRFRLRDGADVSHYETREKAEEALRELIKNSGIVNTVHSLDITPAIQKAAEQGLPLFSAAPEQKRAQVAGIEKLGQLRDTESIDEITQRIRTAYFDSKQDISDESTAAAWQVFEEMTNPVLRAGNARRFLDSMGGSRIALALYKGEVMRYGLKLAAAGDDTLFRAMLDQSEDFITVLDGGASTAGSALRGEGEFAGDPVMQTLKRVFLEDRLTSAQKKSGLQREKFDELLKELKNLNLDESELNQFFRDEQAVAGKSGGKTLAEEIEELLEKNTVERKEAEKILDEYERSQTEWLKEPKKLSKVRQVIKDSLGGRTAKYTDEAEYVAFVSGRLQEISVPKDIADRLAYEVWKDKAARESAVTSRLRSKESRRQQNNAESLISKLEQEQMEIAKPAARNDVLDIFKRMLSGNLIERDAFISMMKRELVNANVTEATADYLSRISYEKKLTLKANENLRARESVNSMAQKIAEQKLRQLSLSHAGVEWLDTSSKQLVTQIITDALKSPMPVDANRMHNAAITTDRLIGAGVDPKTAQELALEIETERASKFFASRMRQMTNAAESRKIKNLLEEIVRTPFLEQQKPGWRKQVAERWFMSNGLDREQAAAAYRIFESGFTRAYEQARRKLAERIVSRGAPKTGIELEQMIRAGVFEPGTEWVDRLAAETGWKKPTPEQFKKLVELDSKLADVNLSPEEQASIREQQMTVLLHVGNREGSAARAVGEAFTASLLSGVRTFTVQLSPLMMTLRDFPIMALSDPKNMMNFAQAIVNSYKANAKSQMKFAWQHDAYGFHLNELEHGYNELKRVSDESDVIIKDKNSSPVAKGLAYTKKLYSFQRFVFRTLNTLDQTQMAVAREWKLAYYASIAFKEAGLKSSDISDLIDAVEVFRQSRFERHFADGLDENTAQIRANSEVQQYVQTFVSNKTGSDSLGREVVQASENDFYAMVGRLPEGLKAVDEGMLSKPMNWFMQKLSEMRGQGGIQNIVATTMFGMVNIPFRSLRFFSDFHPYGLIRYGIYKYRQNTGRENYWKQSYGNVLQARARLRMAIAGTITMLVATAWGFKKSSADDDAGNEGFGIYITGKGPDNKVLADAWSKRGFKQYSLNFVFDGRLATVPLTRAGESLIMPFISAAAADDAAWKIKEAALAGREVKFASAYTTSLIGEHLQMTGQSGIFQTLGQIKTLEQSGGNVMAKGAAKLIGGATSATAIPFKQLLAGLSEMMVGSLDNSSLEAIVANQFPVIGLPFQHPAVNRFGDKMYDRSWYGKVSRLGFPVAFQVDRVPQNEKVYEFMASTGIAPAPIKRTEVENKYGDLSEEVFASYVKKSGALLKDSIASNMDNIKSMNPYDARKLMMKLANDADEKSAQSLGMVKAPPASERAKALISARSGVEPSTIAQPERKPAKKVRAGRIRRSALRRAGTQRSIRRKSFRSAIRARRVSALR